jgi:hypothetical protein
LDFFLKKWKIIILILNNKKKIFSFIKLMSL